MKASDHGYFVPLTFDVRVRERLYAAGNITQPQVERYLSELPDLEAQAEALGIDQPAMGSSGAHHHAPPAPAMAAAPAPSAPAMADVDSQDDDDDEAEST